MEEQEIYLTEDNLPEWKKSLNSKMEKRYGIKGYAEQVFCDGDWLKEYLGASDEEAILDEVQYWD